MNGVAKKKGMSRMGFSGIQAFCPAQTSVSAGG